MAFKGCSSLRTVTFEEKAPKNCDKSFHNCPIEIIYAPASSVSDFSVFKEAYLIGFVLLLKKGGSIEDEIVKQNNKYIKQNVRKLYATKSEDLFEYILRNKLIPLEDIDELVTKFNKEKNVARVAALIDYKEKNYTEKQRERQFNKQFEIREPTLAELKKIWTFVKKEDGTYRISAYNGEEVDIVIPSMLKGANVTEVGNGRACFFSEQLREKVMNVTLPEGIATIGTKAFNDCKSLKSITIPSSVTVMGCRIFDGCHGITVYCRCQALPAGWDKDWDRIGWGGRVNVVWGYKGD